MGLVGSSSPSFARRFRTPFAQTQQRRALELPPLSQLKRKSLNLKMVRKERFELSRSCERQPLKLVRLPVPPLSRGWVPRRRCGLTKIRVIRVIRGPAWIVLFRVIRGSTSSQAVRASSAEPAAVRPSSARPAVDPSELTRQAQAWLPVPRVSTIPLALVQAQSPAPVRQRPA